MLRECVHSNESVAKEDQHTLHFGCDGSVCADSSDFTNWQISLSDLAFAMEFDASELSMAEPPTSTIDKEAWQFLGHSLRDDTVTNAITQDQIAAIAAIMRNTTLSASEKQRRS